MSSANWEALLLVWLGTKCTIEVNKQIITIIELNKPSQLPDSGNGLTKSIPMDSQE